MSESSLDQSPSLDIYRNTSLRYLGYFGLLDRICAPVIPGNILKTVAMSYMISDVADKSSTTANESESKYKMYVNASDAIIWQAASSVLIPALLLKSFSEQARKLEIYRKFATFRSGALPYFLGVALLPILSYRLDESVNFVMDKSYRKWFKGDAEIREDVIEAEDLSLSNTSKSKEFHLNYERENFDEIYEELKFRCQSKQCKETAEQQNNSSTGKSKKTR